MAKKFLISFIIFGLVLAIAVILGGLAIAAKKGSVGQNELAYFASILGIVGFFGLMITAMTSHGM